MNNKPIKLKREWRGTDSTTFTGRPQGAEIRAILRLDTLDKDDNDYSFIIPNDTTSFNSSFYLGLCFKSIKYFGSTADFQKKYSFIYEEGTHEILKDKIIEDIEDSIRQADNDLRGLTGLDF